MEQYIPKSALLAEIEKRKGMCDNHYGDYWNGCYNTFIDILSFIDTLEVRGGDLEKHLKEDIEDVFFDLNGVAVKGATYYLTVEDVKDIARHFFELGLKAQHDNWKVENLWKPANGDDLPEIDREVIALTQPYPNDEHLRVAFAHRPSKYAKVWNSDLGERQVVEIDGYDKGGWNQPNVKWWLDVKLPKEIKL